jgi:formylglycine-generating enzyme required for sulfatase activity
MELIKIPEGEFQMGCSNADSSCDEDESPPKKISIKRPFFIGKYEVTKGEFTKFISETGQTNFADGYVIYRETKPGNGIFRRVTRIARDTSNVNLQTTWVDKNTYIPGTSSAYIGDFNSRGANTPLRTTSITQLMPVHSTRYSIIGPYLWGAVNFYWTPIFYAINKFIKIRNIGIE